MLRNGVRFFVLIDVDRSKGYAPEYAKPQCLARITGDKLIGTNDRPTLCIVPHSSVFVEQQ